MPLGQAKAAANAFQDLDIVRNGGAGRLATVVQIGQRAEVKAQWSPSRSVLSGQGI
jgi:hypothetical protein